VYGQSLIGPKGRGNDIPGARLSRPATRRDRVSIDDLSGSRSICVLAHSAAGLCPMACPSREESRCYEDLGLALLTIYKTKKERTTRATLPLGTVGSH
jgi:hypothetical protein